MSHSDSPRLLTKQEAAAYCRLTLSGFHDWVTKGRLPKALPGTRRWDRSAIDAALDRLSNPGAPSGSKPTTLAQYRERRDARKAQGR